MKTPAALPPSPEERGFFLESLEDVRAVIPSVPEAETWQDCLYVVVLHDGERFDRVPHAAGKNLLRALGELEALRESGAFELSEDLPAFASKN